MGQLITKLAELFIQGDKVSIFKLFIVIFLAVIILPKGLDYFYENIRTEQKIRILKELIDIDKNNIDDQRLRDYYESVLDSISKNNTSLFGIVITNDKPTSIKEYFIPKNIYKFISGSFWWLLLFIMCLFVKQDTIGVKIAVQVIFFVIILIFGIIGVRIPTFSSLIINIIGFPLIQIIIIILIVLAVKKMKKQPSS